MGGGARVASARWRCMLGGCRGFLLGRCASQRDIQAVEVQVLSEYLAST